MSIKNFFRFKPVEYFITNPEKTDKFYYGKYGAFPDSSFFDTSHKEVFHNPNIMETSHAFIMKGIISRNNRVILLSLLFSCCFTIILLTVSFFLKEFFPGFGVNLLWFYLLIIFPLFYILVFLSLNRVSGFFKLKYTLAGHKNRFYQDVIHHLSHLIYADNIWHVNKIVPNRNPKDFGGVKQIYHRCRVKIAKTRPFFIDSNITVYSINYSSISLYFLPDCILVRQNRSYSYYYYSDLFLYYTEKPSLEKKNPPRDAPVIGQRWLHPNKDGSRDKRYKYNPQIPVLLLSEFLIYFKGGFQSYFQISNLRITQGFFSFLSSYAVVAHKRGYPNKKTASKPPGDRQKEKAERTKQDTGQQYEHENKASQHFTENTEIHENTNTQTSRVKYIDKATIKAFRMLGVLPGTQFEDVKRNYRLLVKRYHPDLNVRKNDLMLKLAERKIREINKAYDHLVKWFSGS